MSLSGTITGPVTIALKTLDPSKLIRIVCKSFRKERRMKLRNVQVSVMPTLKRGQSVRGFQYHFCWADEICIPVKVLNGAVWQGRLAKFVGSFTQRRDDFQFALTVHSAIAINNANIKLDHVDERTRIIAEKMEMMLAKFQELTTPEERKLKKAIQQKGGKEAIQGDQRLLEQVMDLEPSTAVLGSKASGGRYSLEDLRKDLGDPEQAIKRNMDVFARKLKVQENRISEEVNAAVRKAGDRILEALEAGPHNRVDDSVSP